MAAQGLSNRCRGAPYCRGACFLHFGLMAPTESASEVVLMRDGKVIYFGSGTEGRIPYRRGMHRCFQDGTCKML